MPENYFSTLRVVDLTGELGPYAAKMFAGLGADVIHVEPMGGDPLRRIGPYAKGRRCAHSSLQYLYYNSGKRGIALDLESPLGRDAFRRLCRNADLLLESCPSNYLDRLGLSYAELSSGNCKLVQTSITLFGHDGPCVEQPGSDLTCSALSGFLYLGGVDSEKPVRAPDNQVYRMAEAYAAVGSSVALFAAMRTGRGQFLDVACVEAGAMALENAAQCWDLQGSIRRGRGREAGSATLHPCADGYIALVAIIGRDSGSWASFVNWMKGERVQEWQIFEDERWIDASYRASEEAYGSFCRVFERYTRPRSKTDLYETGQSYKVAVTPVSDGRDLLDNPQLRHRGFWQSLHNETLDATVTYPGAPYEFGDLQWRLGVNAPRLGQHTAEVLRECGYSTGEIDNMITTGAAYAEVL